jgi:hypothetical protein
MITLVSNTGLPIAELIMKMQARFLSTLRAMQMRGACRKHGKFGRRTVR